ncbi:hypothetical protein E4T66_17640 [Sinimarinibacterium sp. CAU 1509]|uniref:hypothetical protein n=1 Tax=Sinimarinibacterium sp. CAU 1509 TaxID=2562283 RepID=UPI0010ABC424|nr:hypothetical protein [Sinimarinibacterium sp. CAU 1509]TJY57231.1 hypothetical protein E4T66_17640 [Sinimarinibacterium sp. CAU 1509]
MRPYLHKSFFQSRSLAYVRRYEDSEEMIVGFRDGTARRYPCVALSDYQSVARSRAPGSVLRGWLRDRKARGLPPGEELSTRQVLALVGDAGSTSGTRQAADGSAVAAASV